MKPLMKPPRSQSATTKPVHYLWEQMDAIVGDPHVDAEGFTRQEFQERYGCSRSNASDRLRKLVLAGKLLEGRRRAANGFVKVYRPA